VVDLRPLCKNQRHDLVEYGWVGTYEVLCRNCPLVITKVMVMAHRNPKPIECAYYLIKDAEREFAIRELES
jgi:hypothetical protein